MKRVVIFASKDVYLNNRLLKIVNSLRKLNYLIDVVSFTRDRNISENVSLREGINLHYIKLKSPPPSKSPNILTRICSYIEFFLNYIKVCLSVKGSIIWCEGLEFGLFGILLAKLRLKRKLLIYDARELYLYNNFFTYRPLHIRLLLWLWELILIKFSDVIIATNLYRLNLMKKIFHIDSNKKLFIIENYTSVKYLNFHEEVDEQYLEFIKGKKVIGYIGEVREGRGIEVILDILRFFSDDIVFVCFGNIDINFNSILKEKIVRFGLEKRVRVFTPVPYKKIFSIIRYFDVGVCIIESLSLNNYYCSPSKFYDYIIAQVPVIISSNPTLVDIVSKFKCGEIIYDLNNRDEVFEKICKVIMDKDNYKIGLVEAGKELTWESQEKLLEGLFNEF